MQTLEDFLGPGIIVEKNILVKMRDGVQLATDVYRPPAAEPIPALLIRQPYSKEGLQYLDFDLKLKNIFAAGYALVFQDTRGRFASEGVFYPVANESLDGADTLDWVAAQPWCSGQVGMTGVSYQGMVQWQAAAAQPESLRAIAPIHGPISIYAHRQGAFLLETFVTWVLFQGAVRELERRQPQGQDVTARLAALNALGQDQAALLKRMPLSEVPELEGVASYYWDFLQQPPDWPGRNQVEVHQKTQVPVLNIGGWYDNFLYHTLANYTGLQQYGGSEQARQQARLIIGPWAHVNFPGLFRERDYGAYASMEGIDLAGRRLRWFDRWVKGVDNGLDREDKRVLIFVMGADEWREEMDWPLPDTEYRPYYLHSEGRANTLHGDGLLSAGLPGDEAADRFEYDPFNPVPTLGGALLLEEQPGTFQFNTGPLDQRRVEERGDVLCYTTPPLEQAVEVTGPVELVLYISSSAVDTDFTGKLADVYPNGRAEILCDGLLRARYRHSLSEPELLVPGQVYELHIGLEATSNLFKVGHRIRLDVSSSNFPRFDRNTNTGGPIFTESAANVKTARNTVYHDRQYPSRLILPVIERD
jgi:putative CocE/NonD family hydrolase